MKTYYTCELMGMPEVITTLQDIADAYFNLQLPYPDDNVPKTQ